MDRIDFNFEGFEEVAEDKKISDYADVGAFCSKGQSKFIYSLLNELDMTKEDFKVDSVSSLTTKEASGFIEQLLDIKKEEDEIRKEEAMENYDDFVDQELERLMSEMNHDNIPF